MTFPMLSSARVVAKGDSPDAQTWRDVALALEAARRDLTGR